MLDKVQITLVLKVSSIEEYRVNGGVATIPSIEVDDGDQD
jgi:hypothetical protein